MKIATNRFILFSLLILFQSVSICESQLLNSVSHVLENITDQKPPTSLGQPSSNSNTPNHQQTSSAAPVQSYSPSPTSSMAPPPTPSPTQNSSEKPTTSSKPSDSTIQHSPLPPTSNSPPPTTNNSPPTLDNFPTEPNTQNSPTTPAPPATSSKSTKYTEDNSTSSSTTASGGGRSKSSKSSKTTSNDSLPEGTNIPSSITNESDKTISSSDDDNSSGNKSGAIVGAVVGSISGIALIAGLLTWGLRKRRANKRQTDFEDFGLADTDFPNKSPGMRSVGLAANATAMGSATPNLPHETFDPYSTQQQYYQPQLEHMDYANTQSMMDYSNNQPQSFYYSQPQDAMVGQGYNTGFYYDNVQQQQQPSTSPSYDMNAAQYPTTGDQFYKPDQVDLQNYPRYK